MAKQKRDVRALLGAYYPAEDGHIPYHHFINRIGFWMATGSGKSLVLIKLIETLWRLMRRDEIPAYPVLVLTARDDLLEQLKAHVAEFNEGRTAFPVPMGQGGRCFGVPGTRLTRTLSRWLNLPIEAGSVLGHLAEPQSSDEVVRERPKVQVAQVVVYFLHVRARKPGADTAGLV